MTLLDVEGFKLPAELVGKEAVLEALTQVAHNSNARCFNALQESLISLAKKIQCGIVPSADEFQFIEAILVSPWWGGEFFGFNESMRFEFEARPASQKIELQKEKNINDEKQLHVVRLHQHFLRGQGQLLALSLPVFKSSIVVNDCIKALKKYIVERVNNKKPATKISTKDNDFLKCPFALEVEALRREVDNLGYIFNDGTLMLEQKEPGLRNFENRFSIEVMTTKMGLKLNSHWRVKGFFNMPSFEHTDYSFHLPLTSTSGLQVPAGVLGCLVEFGRAKPFAYFAEWGEMYSP